MATFKTKYTGQQVEDAVNAVLNNSFVSETTVDNKIAAIDVELKKKINATDIINNLTTNDSSKPLSAAQGVAIKALIDDIDVPTKVSDLTNDKNYLTSYTETDPTVPSWAKASTKPSYTADEVGADASGTASSAVSAHNTDKTAHADIRNDINRLSSEKVDKDSLTLGLHSDGKYYIFVNGTPVGTGMKFSNSDIFGYVDENNNIILNGNLTDGSYNVKYEMEDSSTVDIGNLVLDSNVYYSVTKNLTNCSISNSDSQAIAGQSYSATVTAFSGYELKNISVTMGGASVAVSGGNISIANVTGDIVITAEAEVVQEDNGNMVSKSIDASGNIFNDGLGYMNGYYVSSTGTSQSVDTNYVATGFMPNVLKTTSDVLYIKGAEITTESHCRYNALESLSKSLGSIEGSIFNSRFNVTTLGTMYYKISPKDEYISKGLGNAIYFRMSLKGTGENLVISTEPID